jgi:hypothetical protein
LKTLYHRAVFTAWFHFRDSRNEKIGRSGWSDCCIRRGLDRASWFTGKQLEGRLAEMVAQANGEIKRSAPEAGVELSYQNYQRGVFTSHMQLVVKPVAGNETAG